MNNDEEVRLNKQIQSLLPCPFCGQKLVVHGDHHGHWIAHFDEPSRCICGTVQLFDEQDVKDWNTRSGSR